MNVVRLPHRDPKTVEPTPDFSTHILRIPQGIAPDSLAVVGVIKDYLSLRSTIFTRQKGWQVWLPTNNDLDQYDQHDAVYVIAQDDVTGAVLGGARLLRTDRYGSAANGLSYMIRDACLGRLPGLPRDLCDDVPPQDALTWEVTRFVSDGTKHVPLSLLNAGYSFLRSERARTVLYLGPPSLKRLAAQARQEPVALGPVRGNDDGRFQVFQCNLI